MSDFSSETVRQALSLLVSAASVHTTSESKFETVWEYQGLQQQWRREDSLIELVPVSVSELMFPIHRLLLLVSISKYYARLLTC